MSEEKHEDLSQNESENDTNSSETASQDGQEIEEDDRAAVADLISVVNVVENETIIWMKCSCSQTNQNWTLAAWRRISNRLNKPGKSM